MLGRLDADTAVGLPFGEIKIAPKVTVSLTYVLDKSSQGSTLLWVTGSFVILISSKHKSKIDTLGKKTNKNKIQIMNVRNVTKYKPASH